MPCTTLPPLLTLSLLMCSSTQLRANPLKHHWRVQPLVPLAVQTLPQMTTQTRTRPLVSGPRRRMTRSCWVTVMTRKVTTMKKMKGLGIPPETTRPNHWANSHCLNSFRPIAKNIHLSTFSSVEASFVLLANCCNLTYSTLLVVLHVVLCYWLFTLDSYSYIGKVHVFCQRSGTMVWLSWKHSTII